MPHRDESVSGDYPGMGGHLGCQVKRLMCVGLTPKEKTVAYCLRQSYAGQKIKQVNYFSRVTVIFEKLITLVIST